MKRILCLGGGGVKIVGAAYYLANIKNQTEFDIYVGTSSGSILASLLAFGMDRESAYVLIKKMSKEVFKDRRSLIKRMFDRHFSLYGNKDHKKLLKQIFHMLPDTPVKPLFITRYDINKKDSEVNQIFTKTQAINNILCSIAAPIFFPPVEMDGSVYIDGAFVANNPILNLIDELKDNGCHIKRDGVMHRVFPKLETMEVLCLTHNYEKKLDYMQEKWYEKMILELIQAKLWLNEKMVIDVAENLVKEFKNINVDINCSMDDCSQITRIIKEWANKIENN